MDKNMQHLLGEVRNVYKILFRKRGKKKEVNSPRRIRGENINKLGNVRST
jgi:hypothetical protein